MFNQTVSKRLDKVFYRFREQSHDSAKKHKSHKQVSQGRTIDAILSTTKIDTPAVLHPHNAQIVLLDKLLTGAHRQALRATWQRLQGPSGHTCIRFCSRVLHELVDRQPELTTALQLHPKPTCGKFMVEFNNNNPSMVEAHAYFLARFVDDVIQALNGTYIHAARIPTIDSIVSRHWRLNDGNGLSPNTWQLLWTTFYELLRTQQHVQIKRCPNAVEAWRILIKTVGDHYVQCAKHPGKSRSSSQQSLFNPEENNNLNNGGLGCSTPTQSRFGPSRSVRSRISRANSQKCVHNNYRTSSSVHGSLERRSKSRGTQSKSQSPTLSRISPKLSACHDNSASISPCPTRKVSTSPKLFRRKVDDDNMRKISARSEQLMNYSYNIDNYTHEPMNNRVRTKSVDLNTAPYNTNDIDSGK